MSSHLYVGIIENVLENYPFTQYIKEKKKKKQHLCHGVLFFLLPIWWLTHCFLPDCRTRKQNDRSLETASMNSSMLIVNKRPMDVLEKKSWFQLSSRVLSLEFLHARNSSYTIGEDVSEKAVSSWSAFSQAEYEKLSGVPE